jgi:purine-nucleoside/S-methyl-5'-thioadenosine phosphorylase / adenosine deaminase
VSTEPPRSGGNEHRVRSGGDEHPVRSGGNEPPVRFGPAELGRSAELAPGVHFLFTGRVGGVSAAPYDTLNLCGAVGDDPAAVAENRRLTARACGLADGRLVWMRQVHGVAVRYANVSSAGYEGAGSAWHDAAGSAGHEGAGSAWHDAAGSAGHEGAGSAWHDAAGSDELRGGGRPPGAEPASETLPEADASFTDVPGLGLGVLVADCAPVLVADPEARIVGVAHAGREGMAAGVVTELLSAMSAAGADPARMHAVIGPHICGGCYEVPAELRDRIAGKVPESGCVTRKGTPGVDVGAGVEAQLARAGLASVASDPRCTAETPSLYSYRRDGRTGRLAGLIWLTS